MLVGVGLELTNLLRYGADPENLFGIDVLPDRIKAAESLNPGIDYKSSDASDLPYGNSSFDIVIQFTAFTSILDDSMKRNIALEIL